MSALTLVGGETIGYSVHHDIIGFKLMTWLICNITMIHKLW